MSFITRVARGFTSQRSVVPRRLHSTNILAGLVSNDQGRLRLGEDTYCNELSTPIKQPYEGVLQMLAKKTETEIENSHMMVSQLQGKLLHMLVSILRPQRILEIGGFTGYSAIAMASALLPKGQLISLELNPKSIEIAEKYVQEAQLQDKIKFIQGPAGESLDYLGQTNPSDAKFDLIFLDADKGGYTNYFDSILKYDLLSDHGLMIVDNVLFFGEVHKHATGNANRQQPYSITNGEGSSKNVKKTALKLHRFNQHVAKDSRVEFIMLPLFDGLSIIRKK